MPTSIDDAGHARNRWRWPLATAVACLLAGGCVNESGRLPLYPASGKVLIDGQPVPGVQIRLHPLDRLNDPNALQPFAVSEQDGTFRLGTYRASDGAPAGRYRATVFWPDRPPGPSPPKDRLDGTYNDATRSGLDVTIAEGPNDLKPFEAQTPTKPAKSRQKAAKSARPDLDGLGESPLR